MLTADRESVRDPLLLAYLDRIQRLRRAPGTIKGHWQTARRYERWLAEVGVTATAVETWQLEEFFEGMVDLSPGTVRSHLRRLRSVYRYAHRRGALDRDPTFDIELPRQDDAEPVVIETHELREMKAQIQSDQAWAQFHLLAFTGLRRCEAIRLQWEEVDLRAATLTVLRGKGGKRREVPIHPQLAEALVSLKGEREGPVIRPKRRARWIGQDTWREILNEYSPGFTGHDFRRTLASSLVLNGVSDPLVDKIMGWAPSSTARRYYVKVAMPELQRAILRAYADDPI